MNVEVHSYTFVCFWPMMALSSATSALILGIKSPTTVPSDVLVCSGVDAPACQIG